MIDTVGQIYSVITQNLFKSNISDPNERYECAKMIADLIGRDPRMEAPKDGVLLYFSKGNGVTEIMMKTDPPTDSNKRVIDELAEALKTFGRPG